MQQMRHPQPTPASEMERRWSLICRQMERRGIDCLILYNINRISSGQIRYVADLHLDRSPVVLLFFQSSEMVFVSSGRVFPEGEEIGAGHTEQISVKSIDVLHYTGRNLGNRVAKELKGRQVKRVGAVTPDKFPVGLYVPIQEAFPEAIEDSSNWFEQIRSIKSPYEIQCAYESARQHDALAAEVQKLIRPGISESYLRNHINLLAFDSGFSDTNVNFGFDSRKPGFPPVFFQNQVLRQEDYIIGLIQGNGYGGSAMEVGRIWHINEPDAAMEKACADAFYVENNIAEQLIPGAAPSEIFRKANYLLKEMGYEEEWRLFGHGEFMDFIERPSIMPEETMPLAENMIVAIHPTVSNKEVSAFACDNYLITAKGAVRINQTPQTLLMVRMG